MAFDKVKTLNAAQKFLELGKIPAAIREYCVVVENEPDDFTTLNMLGDLYVRVNNRSAAISCFRTIAEHFREQDFALKAIAMFKKIDRLQPNDPEIALQLADLYAQQHLVVDARAHYLIVAESYKKSGATLEGLEVLRKIANLDPQNTDIRIKLAEGYLKQEMKDEAVAAFTEAGQHLLARSKFDAALDAFTRAIEIYPADHSALKGFLATHVGRGTADEAAAVIERTSADDPDDVVILSLLATAYVNACDGAAAERVTDTLVTKQPSEVLKYVDVARVYLKQEELEDAIRLIEKICDQMLAEREDSLLLTLIDEILSCDASNLETLRLQVRVYWWQRDVDKSREALERMASAARVADRVDDERYALTQLTRIAPELTKYAERLEQIGGAIDTPDEEALSLLDATAEATVETDQFTFAQPEASPTGESEFEWNSVDSVETSGDVTEDWAEPGFTFEAVVAEELSSPSSESPAKPATATDSDAERKAAFCRQELESVDFYIAQGYLDIAHDTLNLLEQQVGPNPDVELRRQKLNNASTINIAPDDAPATIVSDHDIEPEPPVVEVVHQVAAANGNGQVSVSDLARIDPGLAEIFEEYRVSAEAEVTAEADADYETHYNLGLAYKEMDLFDEALEEFQIAVKMIPADDRTSRYLQCCNLLGHCFVQKGVLQAGISWFQKGLSSPGASEDERQALRYELGSAYEQNGDLRRALELFTEIYGINVTYRGVKDRMRSLQARIAAENGDAVPQLSPVRTAEQLLN